VRCAATFMPTPYGRQAGSTKHSYIRNDGV
jgi:hypothetical protein